MGVSAGAPRNGPPLKCILWEDTRRRGYRFIHLRREGQRARPRRRADPRRRRPAGATGTPSTDRQVQAAVHRPPPPERAGKAAPEDTAAENAAVAQALANQSPNTTAVIASNFARVRPPPEGPATATSGATLARAGQPFPAEFTSFPAAIVLENARTAIRQYGTMFGGNPVGDNAEITAQLSGKNPKGINFVKADAGMRVNGNGELIDPWGTPYFFHQLSGTVMEIRSAGPDKTMWTDDDVVTR